MKKTLLLLLLIPAFSHAQKMSCCKSSSTEQFNLLASTESFASAHLTPLPFNYTADKGTMVTFECSDGKKGNAFEIKAAKPTDKWLFIFHEWWGLNDYIKREVERYSNDMPDVNVMAIDLYDGKVAETPEVAQETMQGIKDERARAIINGAIGHAGSKAKIGTLGWCYGGGWSLQATLMNKKQAIACVMYYGMPETDIDKLKSLNTDILGIFASKDAWITPEVVSTFQKNMSTAGKTITVHSFNADHAFANPSNPKFDRTATADAHKLVLAYLRNRLK